MTSKLFQLPLHLGLALLAINLPVAAAARTTGGAKEAGQHPVHTRHPRARGELGRFLRTLHATPAQRAVVLEEARAADPIARAARIEGAKIRARARSEHKDDPAAARAEIKTQLRGLRERTLDDLQPLARRVLSTLTPEQRTKLEEAARKRGKTLDEGRLEKITSWLLTRPRTMQHGERERDR